MGQFTVRADFRVIYHWSTCVRLGPHGGGGCIQCCPHNSHWGLSRYCSKKKGLLGFHNTGDTHQTNTAFPSVKSLNCGCDWFCSDCYLRSQPATATPVLHTGGGAHLCTLSVSRESTGQQKHWTRKPGRKIKTMITELQLSWANYIYFTVTPCNLSPILLSQVLE